MCRSGSELVVRIAERAEPKQRHISEEVSEVYCSSTFGHRFTGFIQKLPYRIKGFFFGVPSAGHSESENVPTITGDLE